jgi:hypothetical protein
VLAYEIGPEVTSQTAVREAVQFVCQTLHLHEADQFVSQTVLRLSLQVMSPTFRILGTTDSGMGYCAGNSRADIAASTYASRASLLLRSYLTLLALQATSVRVPTD